MCDRWGYYRTAGTLVNGVHAFVAIVPVLLYPRMIEWAAQGARVLWQHQCRVIVVTSWCFLPLAVTVFALSPTLYRLIYGAEFLPAAYPFAVLVVAKMLMMLGGIYACGIAAQGHDRWLLLITSISRRDQPAAQSAAHPTLWYSRRRRGSRCIGSVSVLLLAWRELVSAPERGAQEGGSMTALKFIAGMFVPHSLVRVIQHAQRQRHRQAIHAGMAVAQTAAQTIVTETTAPVFDYEAAFAWLAANGLDENQCRLGSMPLTVLESAWTQIERLRRRGPVRLLHIGNFVGVSLCYFASKLDRSQGDLIVSLDPNIEHRGIQQPAAVVTRMAAHFGLGGVILPIQAFSLQANPANDGATSDYSRALDPSSVRAETGFEHGLENLAAIAVGQFSAILLDGNHDRAYLNREIDICTRLLAGGGLLLLDDIDAAWENLQALYEKLRLRDGFEEVDRAERLGVLRKTSHAAERVSA